MSRLFKWLLGRAASETSEAPPPPPITALPAIPSPRADTADEAELLDDAPPESEGLDEIYTLIDYVDSKGQESRRRLTLLSIGAGPHGPVLRAICHERKAFRMFRCDRIQCFIDHDDGEVIEPDVFFRRTLAIDIERFAVAPAKGFKSAPGSPVHRARALRDRMRAPLSLLVLAATADNHFHPEELEAICQYVESDNQDLIFTGEIGIVELDAMTDVIRKMHPTRASIPTHLKAINRMDDLRFDRLERALRAVILADGEFSPEEQDFVAELMTLRGPRGWDRIAALETDWIA